MNPDSVIKIFNPAPYKYDIITSGKVMYEKFCKQFPSVKLTYIQYKQAIEEINIYYRNHILDSAHITFLPFGMGKIMIQKNKRKIKLSADKTVKYLKAPVNWNESKKNQKIIYHTNDNSDGYTYRYMWFGASSYIQPFYIWKMSMTQESKTALKTSLDNGMGPKYRECISARTNYVINQELKQLHYGKAY